MKILGIETSCDETAAAVVNDNRQILSNIVHSQIAEHAPYGGVVPEIASRSHIVHIDDVVSRAMKEADTDYSELDAVAVTAGPGLIGGVIVGLMMAKAIASAANIPLIGVNHLEGHALTPRLTDEVTFPFLLLLVSGGHCQILQVRGVGDYQRMGGTLDDALGEAYDKTAKMLGLGYPGGPIVEEYAKKGNPKAYDFPRPLLHRKDCDFSFSGMKTSVFRLIDKNDGSDETFRADVCASFQTACGDVLAKKMDRAMRIFKDEFADGKHVVIAGGVAANVYLRKRVQTVANTYGLTVTAPPLHLCTDNAAMIAWAGIEKFRLGHRDELTLKPRARWPLCEAENLG